MRKILTFRLFRFLVCLVLICALLINVSPIKAKAVLVELTAAELLKWGIVAFATLATCGVVYQITSENQLISLGEIFYNEAYNYSSSAEKLDDFDELSTIIGEAVDGGTIPLRGPHISPENGGESLLAAVSILLIDLFCNKNTGNKTVTFQESKLCTTELMTPYYDPGFDGGLGYTCVSYATSSVYRYRVCTANSHLDYYFSDSSFSVRFYRADGTYTYSNAKKYQMDIDGITYVAYTASAGIQSYTGGSGEYNPGCSYGTTSDAQRAGFIAANIGPRQETMEPMYDGSPDFDKATHSISFPEIDISSVNTLDKIREFTGKLSPNLDLYEILEQLTGGAAPEIVPLPEPEPDPGEDTDPTTSTEPTVQPDPGIGTNPDPGTGTNPDPGTGTNPDPGTGTNPDPGTGTNPDPGTGTDPGTDSGSSSWQPPSDPKQFLLVDLSKFFPFCIPFDLFEFFKLLNADPVAPVLHWEIQDLAGQTYSLTVDLSEWDSVALLFRRLQLFLFVTGLAAASRKFIKW